VRVRARAFFYARAKVCVGLGLLIVARLFFGRGRPIDARRNYCVSELVEAFSYHVQRVREILKRLELLIFLSSTAFERILIELSIAGVAVMLMVSPVISFSFRLIATKYC
jgi:hypothetical protein